MIIKVLHLAILRHMS